MEEAEWESQPRLEIPEESAGKEGVEKIGKVIPSSGHFSTVCQKDAIVSMCLLWCM